MYSYVRNLVAGWEWLSQNVTGNISHHFCKTTGYRDFVLLVEETGTFIVMRVYSLLHICKRCVETPWTKQIPSIVQSN